MLEGISMDKDTSKKTEVASQDETILFDGDNGKKRNSDPTEIGHNESINEETLLKIWGKADRENQAIYHPLIYHLMDTYHVCVIIWDRMLSSTVKRKMASSLGVTTTEARSMIPFFAACHDIGKATPGFQDRNEVLKRELHSIGLTTKPSNKYHGQLTTYILSEENPLGSLDIDVPDVIQFSIGVHHGQMFGANEIEQINRIDAGTDSWTHIRGGIFTLLINLVGSEKFVRIHLDEKYSGSLFVLLAGLTSVSDWIASSEDFFQFEGGDLNLNEYTQVSKSRAKNALDRLHWDIPEFDTRESTFHDLFPEYAPNKLQECTIDIAKGLIEPALVIIEAPMGLGKTEAALFLQNHFLNIIGQSGCYIALPTQATANQMFDRTLKYLKNQKNPIRNNLHLLHGHAMLSNEYQLLKSRETLTDPWSPIADEWFTYRKRGLLSTFGVGTVDQALLSVLPTKHFFIRLFALAGKTVILDEVHAYDVYMSELLDRMITWLRYLGSSVIILSATLPSNRRNELLQAYSIKNELMPTCNYPRITSVCQDKILMSPIPLTDDHSKFVNKKVLIQWTRYNAIPSIVLDKLDNGGCLAIICNTVSRAQELYKSLKEDPRLLGIDINLFHARYPFGMRNDKEGRFIKEFGKEGRDLKKSSVLIATQIIEQSLDLDFDLMISEMAPVDLVLQRTGRLHRHKRERPEKLKKPIVMLIEPEENDDSSTDFGASKYIYSEYILLRSFLELKKCKSINFSSDIEMLIERVYCGEASNIDETMENRLEQAKTIFEVKKGEKRFKAKRASIPKPSDEEPWEQIHDLLEENNIDVHTTLFARTRDIGPTMSIICAYKFPQGISLTMNGVEMLDLEKVPNQRDDLIHLLNRSVTISHPSIVGFLKGLDVPKGWEKSSIMKHCRLIPFEQAKSIYDPLLIWKFLCNKHQLILDEDLGVIIKKVE